MSPFYRAAWRWCKFILALATVAALTFGALKPFIGFPYERWVWALFAAGIAYIASVLLYFRDIPVSILGLKIDLYFRDKPGDEPGSTVHVSREYILRANVPGVSAWHFSNFPGYGGRIPRDELKLKILGDGYGKVKYEWYAFGHQNRIWNCVHEITPRFPYLPIFPIVPRWVLIKGQEGMIGLPRKIFGKSWVVTLSDEAEHYNDFNIERLYSLQAELSPVRDVTVVLHFQLQPAQVRAWRVHKNAVYKISPIDPREPGSAEYTITLDRLNKEILYIEWEFS